MTLGSWARKPGWRPEKCMLLMTHSITHGQRENSRAQDLAHHWSEVSEHNLSQQQVPGPSRPELTDGTTGL